MLRDAKKKSADNEIARARAGNEIASKSSRRKGDRKLEHDTVVFCTWDV